jgi:hypothetical protein
MTWNAAAPVTRTVAVVKGDQQIVFANPGNRTFQNGAKFTLAATVNSQLPITFTSSNPSVLSIQGREATIRGRGTVVVTASQVGNALWNAAPAVGRSFRIW